MTATIRLGLRLRARRSQLGLTLMAVATDAGLSVPYVANLEKGRGNPTLDVIVGLAQALSVAPAELLAGDDESTDQIDESFVGLPAILVAYAQGKILRAQTEWIAAQCDQAPDEFGRSLLRAMAAVPRPTRRELTESDCRRMLDTFLLIMTDPEDAPKST